MLVLKKMARSTFYYHLERSRRPDKWADVKSKVLHIYDLHKGRYGYRRITQALLDDYGLVVNHKTVKRLMDELGVRSKVRVGKYRSYKGEVGTVAPNLLGRDFSTACYDQKWVTDVTEFRLLGTKAYLSPAIELHNGEVIAYTIRDHPDLPMVLDMVDIAVRARPGCKGVILHSDQGSLYQSARYREKLATAGIVQSMSRKGNCYDNACAESFFSRLKAEFDYASFNSMDQFKAELHKFIRYYNEERIKSRLGTSPVKYRKRTEVVV
jgi:putative transposase